jgi:hypothetical protein
VRGGVVRGLSAVHPQHIETGLYQPFGSLLVEVDFGVGAAGAELETVVWSALVKALRDHGRARFQDHRQVGAVSLSVELPQKRRVDTVEPLNHQTGGDVPVGDNGCASLEFGAYFGLDVVIPVSRVQAGQRMTSDGFG